MHVGTVLTRPFLPQARTLAASFRQHNPEARFTAVVVGDIEAPEDEPFDVISDRDLGQDDDLRRRRLRYTTPEYVMSIKPIILERLLESDELAVYLDADFYVLASFAALGEAMAGADVGLTPHLLEPLPDDDLQPSYTRLLISGVFNAGFVAVTRSEGSAAFLRWWDQQLVTGCLFNQAEGYFVDQRWLDLAPGLFPGVRMIRDSSWNIGHWNLPASKLARGDDGWTVNGGPLRAFHFSGFDPRTPGRVSRNQDRTTVSPGSPLAQLLNEYAAAMMANGYEEFAGRGSDGRRARAVANRVYRSVARTRAQRRGRP